MTNPDPLDHELQSTAHEDPALAAYDAGYAARVAGSCAFGTATTSWQAGWRDADRDIEMGISNRSRLASECVEAFGSGWQARLCELAFDDLWADGYKRDWVRADIALGFPRGRREG